MNITKKVILTPVVFLLSGFIFAFLDNGIEIERFDQIIQPIFFAVILTSDILLPSFRKNLIIFSCCLLVLMILIYLLQNLMIADWIGRLGFGILFITIFSYTPEIIKRGYLEKF
ncbi:hypothetical protein HYW41_02205 [Candidatus Daviesbacteria bacterium]|nr:hypothetical protein [Candidatus Daviesbacteria bacterium]